MSIEHDNDPLEQFLSNSRKPEVIKLEKIISDLKDKHEECQSAQNHKRIEQDRHFANGD